MQCLRAARYKRTQKAQEVSSLGASGANPNDLKAEWPRVERSSFGDPKERIEPTLLSIHSSYGTMTEQTFSENAFFFFGV